MPDTYIDDADPQVQYSTGWGKAGVEAEYNWTTHWTEQDGATASLFFTGIGVVVYGTIAPKEVMTDEGPPVTLFTVDGGDQANYTAVPIPDKVQYRVKFFSSQSLQNGQHTIVITKFPPSSPFFLDYFVVSSLSPSPSSEVVAPTPALTTIATTNNTAVETSTMLPSSTSPDTNGNSTNSNHTPSSRSFLPSPSTSFNTNPLSGPIIPTTSSTITNTNSDTPTSAIVGTVLGCFVLILTAIFIMLLRRHLRYKSSRSTSLNWPFPAHTNSQSPAVVPFMKPADNKMKHRTLQSSSSTSGACGEAPTSHLMV